jgi:hypothetical protein
MDEKHFSDLHSEPNIMDPLNLRWNHAYMLMAQTYIEALDATHQGWTLLNQEQM